MVSGQWSVVGSLAIGHWSLVIGPSLVIGIWALVIWPALPRHEPLPRACLHCWRQGIIKEPSAQAELAMRPPIALDDYENTGLRDDA
jgi:hypothetical protein